MQLGRHKGLAARAASQSGQPVQLAVAKSRSGSAEHYIRLRHSPTTSHSWVPFEGPI